MSAFISCSIPKNEFYIIDGLDDTKRCQYNTPVNLDWFISFHKSTEEFTAGIHRKIIYTIVFMHKEHKTHRQWCFNSIEDRNKIYENICKTWTSQV